jgi:hypothetical protein
LRTVRWRVPNPERSMPAGALARAVVRRAAFYGTEGQRFESSRARYSTRKIARICRGFGPVGARREFVARKAVSDSRRLSGEFGEPSTPVLLIWSEVAGGTGAHGRGWWSALAGRWRDGTSGRSSLIDGGVRLIFEGLTSRPGVRRGSPSSGGRGRPGPVAHSRLASLARRSWASLVLVRVPAASRAR